MYTGINKQTSTRRYKLKCKNCKQEYGYIDDINLCHTCYIEKYTKKTNKGDN